MSDRNLIAQSRVLVLQLVLHQHRGRWTLCGSAGRSALQTSVGEIDGDPLGLAVTVTGTSPWRAA